MWYGHKPLDRSCCLSMISFLILVGKIRPQLSVLCLMILACDWSDSGQCWCVSLSPALTSGLVMTSELSADHITSLRYGWTQCLVSQSEKWKLLTYASPLPVDCWNGLIRLWWSWLASSSIQGAKHLSFSYDKMCVKWHEGLYQESCQDVRVTAPY